MSAKHLDLFIPFEAAKVSENLEPTRDNEARIQAKLAELPAHEQDIIILLAQTASILEVANHFGYDVSSMYSKIRAILTRIQPEAIINSRDFGIRFHVKGFVAVRAVKDALLPGFPRAWELFGFILPKKIRERVYEPRRHELLEDYVLAKRMYRTKWAKRWLGFCFTVRTLLAVIESLRAAAFDQVVHAFFKMLGRG